MNRRLGFWRFYYSSGYVFGLALGTVCLAIIPGPLEGKLVAVAAGVTVSLAACAYRYRRALRAERRREASTHDE